MNKIVIENLTLQYADGTESLRNINMGIREQAITVLFGPAGGGKSSLLRCLNRLNDLTEVKTASGRILLDGENILDPKTDVIALRRKVGMVFARPVVLPLSIRGNLTYGLEVMGENAARNWMRPSSAVSNRPRCGMKSRSASMIRPSPSPAGSSSACAWPVPWPWSRKSSCLTSRPAASTLSPPAKWRPACKN